MFPFFGLYHVMLSGNLYGSEIRQGIFLVLNFAPGISWGFLLEALGILLGCHLKSGLHPLPLRVLINWIS